MGVAPIYHKLPLYIRLKNANDAKTFETDVDIRQWIEGKYSENISLEIPADMAQGEYEVQIGIGGEGKPSVVFATDAPQDNEYSVVATVKVI